MRPKTILTPIFFFLLLLIDGQITRVIGTASRGQFTALSCLLLIAFIPAVQSFSKTYSIILALILGLLGDSYFIGILGIHGFLLPLAVFFLYKYRDVINTNVLSQFFGLIIFITLYEVGLALMQFLFQLAQPNIIWFITQLLGPTLIANTILFFLVIFPFRKIYK